jgi:hypothetical protein
MVTANDVTQYHGDAALSTEGMQKYGDIDVTQMNSNGFNLAYLNMQKNKALWDQKIKDRDELMGAIASEKVNINQALPQDREKLIGMLTDAKQMWLDHDGDLKSDPKAWIEFNDKLTKLREANTYAQSRYSSYTTGMAEAAKELDPTKKQAMISHYNDEQKKDLYQPFLPYQQSLDWDNEKVNRQIGVATTDEGKDETQPYYRKTRDRTDVAKGYRDYTNSYMYDDKNQMAINVDAFLKSFYGQDGLMHPDAVQKKVEDINARLKEIARSEGYKVDDPNVKLPAYLQPMKVAPGQDGTVQSAGTKWDDWYKIQLTNQYQNKVTSAYDKDAALLGKTQSEIEANKALAAQRRSAAGLNDSKAKQANAKTAAIKQTFIPEENYDELDQKSEVWQNNDGNQTVVDWNNLSENTRNYLGVQPFTNKKGLRWVNLVPANVVDAKGQKLTDDQVDQLWQKVKPSGKWKTKLQFLKDYTTSVGGSFEVEAVGREDIQSKAGQSLKTGRSNRLATYQNQVKDLKLNDKTPMLEDDNTPAPEQ